MFVDELTIYARAGKGGDGVERWLRQRRRPLGGPAGGNGGNGGNVYVRGVKNLNQLAKYTGSKEFSAENGEHGKSRSRYGKNGDDCIIDVPIGAIVTDRTQNRTYAVNSVGECVKVLSGGHGGLGNEYFKSSTNTTPTETTRGKSGESGTFYIELQLTADVGLIGLPNAGKSSLLNALTNARSEVGSYPFTTTEPHLGDCFGFIIADIPGLIEGASEGKGLGHKFLRHISRTRMLLHLVSLEESEPYATYMTVRNELKTYDPLLLEKPEWVVLTKTDTVTDAVREEQQHIFEARGITIRSVSVLDDDSVKALRDELTAALRREA